MLLSLNFSDLLPVSPFMENCAVDCCTEREGLERTYTWRRHAATRGRSFPATPGKVEHATRLWKPSSEWIVHLDTTLYLQEARRWTDAACCIVHDIINLLPPFIMSAFIFWSLRLQRNLRSSHIQIESGVWLTIARDAVASAAAAAAAPAAAAPLAVAAPSAAAAAAPAVVSPGCCPYSCRCCWVSICSEYNSSWHGHDYNSIRSNLALMHTFLCAIVDR